MTWQVEKRRLCEQKYLHEIFSNSPDERICEVLKDLGGGASYRYKYEPLLLNILLPDLSSLVERCLAYRREARELEILAVRSAMDYEQFRATAPIDQQLDKINAQNGLKEIAKRTQSAAALAFGGETALERGFASISAGRVDEISQDILDGSNSLFLINQRWKIIISYQEAYWLKNNEPGNALNYAERCKRVYELLEEDLEEAYVKAIAVREGIRQVYDFNLSALPAFNPTSFLDEFVNWIREAIRFIEYKSQNEIEYSLIIPLTQPWLETGKALVSTDEFSSSLNTSQQSKIPFEVDFDLGADCFFGKSVRLRAAGLSVGTSVAVIMSSGGDRNSISDSYVKTRAILYTPEQVDSKGEHYCRPPVVLGNVSTFNGFASPAIEGGASTMNVNPIGHWKIRLEPLVVYKDSTERLLGGEHIDGRLVDLKLHLRLCTIDGQKNV